MPFDKVKARAREIIEKLRRHRLTLNQFERTHFESLQTGKFQHTESHIQTLRDTDIRQRQCYFETLRLLKYYDSKLNQRRFPTLLRAQFRYVPAKARFSGQYPQYFKVLRLIESSETRRCRFGSGLSFRQRRLRIAKLKQSHRTLPPASRLAKPARTESAEQYARQLFSLLLLRNVACRYGHLTTDHIQRLTEYRL